MYKSVSLACMSVHQIHAWCLLRSEENVGSLELELQSCELPQGCWDSNLGIPQKQVFLTAKVSLQPYKDFFLNYESKSNYIFSSSRLPTI